MRETRRGVGRILATLWGISLAQPGTSGTLAPVGAGSVTGWPQRRGVRARALGIRAGALGLLLMAFALRVFLLGDKNVWWDEALAVWAARQGLAQVTLWTASDVHPPLFFWALWVWLRVAGQTEFALRFLVVAAGTLTAAAAFATARRAGGQVAGLAALGLVAVARFEVWWSMELRMYMVAAAAVGFALYAATRWLGASDRSQSGGRRWLVVYAAASVAAVYTLYLALVGVAACAVGMLAYLMVADGAPRHTWARAGAWLAAQAAVLVAFVPWLALALPRMQSWSSQRSAPATPAFVAQLWATLLATGQSTDIYRLGAWTLWFLAAAFVLPVAFVALDRRHRPSGQERTPALWLTAPFVVLPPVAVWLTTQPRSIFYSPSVEARYLAPFAAPVYVLAALCLAAVWRRRRLLGGALTALALVPLVVALPGHYRGRVLGDELQSMALAIWSQAEPGDVVLLSSGDRYPLFLYYYDQPWDVERGRPAYEWRAPGAAGTVRPQVVPFPDKTAAPLGESAWQGKLADVVVRGGRVWLAEVEPHLRDPDGLIPAWLEGHSHLVLSEAYGANALHLYDPSGRRPSVTAVSSRWPGVRPPASDLGPGYHPVVGLPVRRLAAGQETDVTLWRRPTGQEPTTADLWISLTPAADPATSDLVVRDSGPAGPGTRARFRLAADDALPGGGHELRLAGADASSLAVAPLAVVGSRAPLAAPASPGSKPAGASAWLPSGATWQLPGVVAPLRLVGGAVDRLTARAGDTVVVDLRWRWGGPPETTGAPAPAVSFVHLVGPEGPAGEGRLWAGADGAPSSGSWTDRPSAEVFDRKLLDLDPGAPPGRYLVEAGIYDPVSLERLTPTGGDQANKRVVLGYLEVRR